MRTYGNKVAHENQNIAERRQPLLFEEEGRVRRRLILQLSFQMMIIVKESNELILENQRLTVASVKPVLDFRKNAAGPNGLAGREGRDTPADYRRVIAVLNFLKPCFPFLKSVGSRSSDKLR